MENNGIEGIGDLAEIIPIKQSHQPLTGER
jgi:hypothetical protein